MRIDKPHGMMVEFWLYAETKDKLDKLLNQKQITEIEWIREEEPKL